MTCQHDPLQVGCTLVLGPRMQGTWVTCGFCNGQAGFDMRGYQDECQPPDNPEDEESPQQRITELEQTTPTPPPGYYKCGQGYDHPVGTICIGHTRGDHVPPR